MKRLFLLAIGCFFVLGLCCNANAANDEEKAQDLLKKLTEKMEAAKSFELLSMRIVEFPGRNGKRETQKLPVKIWFEAPDRFKISWNEGGCPFTVYSDGKKIWIFAEKWDQYTEHKLDKRKPGEPIKIPDLQLSNLSSVCELISSGKIFEDFRTETKSYEVTQEKNTTVIKMERSLNTQRGPLPVLDYLHIDNNTNLPQKVLRIMRPNNPARKVVVADEYENFKFNEKIKADVFEFHPPKSAKKVERIEPPTPKPGTVCPDFSVQGMDGKTYSVKGFRGKPTLINVWATWCAPCRKEMPDLNKIYEEFKSKINMICISSEDKSTISAFIKKSGFTMPFAHDPKKAASQTLFIRGIPRTVILDKDGKIVEDFVGSRSYDVFKKALIKAGAK